MEATDSKSVLALTSQTGESFVKENFYKVFDGSRQEIFRLYRDKSIVIWNGTPYGGLASIMDFFKSLPSSQHTIESIDCQPMILPGEQAAKGILVNVAGMVSYSGDKQRSFSQTFVLAQEPDNPSVLFVANDCFRLTSQQ
eukprot:TRINITY_DN8245_c0_g1_i1.p1 TRINITY_DN8245_c0_g1~~TRINITY_DN8245_c0_g1_i1.p1  ORF type:complete len:140 (+),score=12.94 TRINITY_DN8245_c0_g1_i1:91-510(+)